MKMHPRIDERRRAIRPAGEPPAPRVLVLSDSALTSEGVIELLPERWRQRVTAAVSSEEAASAGRHTVAIIDLATAGAVDAIPHVRAGGASAILLLASVQEAIDTPEVEEADAILLRDEVEARTLRVALAAGSLGLRVTPRGLPIGPAPSHANGQPGPEPARPALGQPAQRALALLAEGMRDAEIALELNLSESATRKLIQRAVRRAGARTRCEAVAAAIRGGELT